MREINFKQLQDRDNIHYLSSEEHPFSGRAIEYFKLILIPTKQIKIKIEFRNGIQHGETEIYYRNGKIARKVYLKEGKFHGEVINYYESGEVKERANYWDGLLHGEQVFYFENGIVMSKYHYYQGVKE